jgi:two-component system, LuxR family, response regulator FixJ
VQFAVDDEPAVLVSLRFLLEAEGFAVKTFTSGPHLLSSKLPGPADCLVIDYKMTAMNGLELVRELKGRGVDTPIILITVHEGALAQAEAQGLQHALLKQFIEEHLVAHIHAAMRKVSAEMRHP